MARKQKLLRESTGHLTVVQQEAKYKAEILAADGLPKLQVTPPNHLKGAAKQEYKRIIASLGKLPLRNLDRVELENYCTWYGIYKQISLDLPKITADIDYNRQKYDYFEKDYFKAVRSSDKDSIKGLKTSLSLYGGKIADLEEQQDKLLRNLDKATKNIKSLASDLGLNVNSRMQMNMPKAEDDKEKHSIMEMFN